MRLLFLLCLFALLLNDTLYQLSVFNLYMQELEQRGFCLFLSCSEVRSSQFCLIQLLL